ncbi:MAG TPA: hypothetical protein PKK06_03015 [Phycisphaerae bacterium]|nr:hypothetical protein [Phycisphaerae bacterium]HNU44656.1 hypothetical protein [Phycisphaerae bacterium]
MRRIGSIGVLAVIVATVLLPGCSAPRVDFTTISCPPRAPELDAYNVFVGKWNWQATLLNADKEDEAWTGTAQWDWTLDNRCLQGHMSVKGAHAEFQSVGLWSWHPKADKYVWTMFNNWGYPQHGTATYQAATKCWRMSYKSVGLDGRTSYGIYTMKVVNDDTLEWTVKEWRFPLHLFKKMEMTGTYTRAK